ncbi:MAG: hypothetical protein ACFFEE_06195, partial [Candidatus Thorarchaeota archaeon]
HSKRKYLLSIKGEEDLSITSKFSSHEMTGAFVKDLAIRIAEGTTIGKSVESAVSYENEILAT